jgi:hypothetical protein
MIQFCSRRWFIFVLLQSLCAAVTVASDTECKEVLANDETSFIQTRKVSSSKSGRALKFMHIPKTGGTSIDSANMHKEPPDFDSLMHQTYSRIAEANTRSFENKYNSSLGVMYDESHASYKHYRTVWLPRHMRSYNFYKMPDGNMCEDLHTSPGNNVNVTDYFDDGASDVFCAVRDPYARYLSAFEMHAETLEGARCDAAGFENFTKHYLSTLKKKPYEGGCLFSPQVNFVYGMGFGTSSQKTYCKHILHTENLDEEFDALMQEYGIDMKLPDNHLMGSEVYSGCTLDRDQVTQPTKDMIFQHFREDFEEFGYEYPK